MLIEAGWRGSTSFRVLCGGEPMPRDLADALLDRASEVWNLYGPTETTVYSTSERVRRDAPITVGRPIANTQVYVLGRAGELQPAGVSGELWIGGDGVADGYLGHPELTAQRFLSNPFVPGTRMYGTGDVVRWTADGRLEHLGRLDDQVKIRGFRIELGEIETALATHASVRQAAAVAFGAAGEARLVAYVVPAGEGIDAIALRQHARERLPEYMVPAVILPLAALPATSNGKLDRKALLALTAGALQKAGGDRQRSTAARTPVEDTLVSIWADVLGVKKVGIDDDFFELGGHSLLAARLMQQLSDIFWMDLPLRLLFEAPTINRMAAVIQQRLEAKHADESTKDVLEINTSGTRPPFVFLHAALQGDGFYCFNLARHLGEDQPMYALGPLGLDGSETPPTVEAIASKQLQSIRRVQPRGPYYLGGFCSSGPVAFELARMLKAAGEQIEIVVLIESGIDECNRIVRFADQAVGALARFARLSPAQRLSAFLVLRRCVRRAALLSDSTLREGATAVVRKVRSVVSKRGSALRQRRARAARKPATTSARQQALSQLVCWRYDRAIEGFVPQPYDGRVVALKAEGSPIDTTAVWRMVAPDLRAQVVRGDHNTCITTQVDSLGANLRGVLREAQDRVSATTAMHPNACADTAEIPVAPDSAAADPQGIVSLLDRTGVSLIAAITPWLMAALTTCGECAAIL
jgi:thioesterase domain-containing protein